MEDAGRSVSIDLAADAATISWGERAPGRSEYVERGGKGVRLLLDAAGDVVGIEVLGWSHRTADPREGAVNVSAQLGEELGPDHPLVRLLSGERGAA